MSERLCPSCRLPLRTGRFGPLELEFCLPCGGAWFDGGELSRLIAAGPPVVRRLTDGMKPAAAGSHVVRQFACPVCRVPLNEVEYASMPGVRLEACTLCEGFWLFRTVLLDLANALEGGPRAQPAWMSGVASAAAAPAPTQTPGPAPAAAAGMVPCPNCDEPNGERAATCWACGKPLQGPVVGTCPRCQANMRRIDSEGVTLSACEGCGGVWLTPGRLNQLLLQPPHHHEAVLRQVDRKRPELRKRLQWQLSCPYCKVGMMSGPLGALTQQPVQTCPKCYGMYLGPGILEDILPGRRG